MPSSKNCDDEPRRSQDGGQATKVTTAVARRAAQEGEKEREREKEESGGRPVSCTRALPLPTQMASILSHRRGHNARAGAHPPPPHDDDHDNDDHDGRSSLTARSANAREARGGARGACNDHSPPPPPPPAVVFVVVVDDARAYAKRVCSRLTNCKIRAASWTATGGRPKAPLATFWRHKLRRRRHDTNCARGDQQGDRAPHASRISSALRSRRPPPSPLSRAACCNGAAVQQRQASKRSPLVCSRPDQRHRHFLRRGACGRLTRKEKRRGEWRGGRKILVVGAPSQPARRRCSSCQRAPDETTTTATTLVAKSRPTAATVAATESDLSAACSRSAAQLMRALATRPRASGFAMSKEAKQAKLADIKTSQTPARARVAAAVTRLRDDDRRAPHVAVAAAR